MTNTHKSKQEKPASEFLKTQEFIERYNIFQHQSDSDLVTVWAMGTWLFSPSAPAQPVTYPYLYLTGGKGSGKTHVGMETFQYICRNHRQCVSITGPSLFRMIGTYDEDTGEVIPHYPTLAMDEIDATYSGNKDEALRGPVNAGYKRGATVPRAAGRTTIEFPVYCPKALLGIDNGHLPETITDRCIRIDMKKATPEQMETIEELYSFDVEDESAELQQMLSNWAKREGMVMRDYRPHKIPTLHARQWEIARSLVQIGRALGIERRIRDALAEVMGRNPEKPDHKVRLYRAIFDLFASMPGEHADRVTSRQIMAKLDEEGIMVPGNNATGLSHILNADGVNGDWIRMREGHPGRLTKKGEDKPTARGYMRHRFDEAFLRFVEDEDEDE